MVEIRANVSEGEDVSGIAAGIGSGEQLKIPPGTYEWLEQTEIRQDNWGIICDPDTVFRVPDGFGDGETEPLLQTGGNSVRSSNNFRLENLTFDSDGRSAPELRLFTRKNAEVRGLEFAMDGPQTVQEHANALTPHVEDPDGDLLVKDLRQFNNGDLGGYADGHSRVGVYVGSANNGTIRLVDPVLQGFPNNGCYVSRQPGTVIIEGGLLMNNNVSAVRVSGGVEVYDTTVVIDTERYTDGAGVIEGDAHNTRGFWGDSKNAGTEGGRIDGASVVIESHERCTGLATILQNPYMNVLNTQFLANTSIDCVRADDGQINVTGCSFDASRGHVTAGSGDITGSENTVSPEIDPGEVPVVGTDNYDFDWSRTHPHTPDRFENLDADKNTLTVFTEEGTGRMDYQVATSGQIIDAGLTTPEEKTIRHDNGTWMVDGSVPEDRVHEFEFVGLVKIWQAEFDTDDYTVLINDSQPPSYLM